MLYNYVWVGGLFYDLPIGFEEKIKEFIPVVKNTISEVIKLVEENTIFIKRTAKTRLPTFIRWRIISYVL
jgi:NADH-quinone oxidoreductase subunit D